MTRDLSRLDREFLQTLFDYRDGVLYWKSDIGSNKVKGKKAGSPNSGGYAQVKINGVLYKAHALVWFLHGRSLPSGYVIDHINGDQTDNRLDNLRAASRQQNNCNASKRVDNKSGVKGVSWYKPTGKWVGQIQHGGVKTHVGLFDSIPDAARAVALKRAEMHGAFARNE